MKKVAIITTHPIQYNAPFFQLLAKNPNLSLKVYYTWGQSSNEVYDPGFGIKRTWDIDLLEGYEHEFIINVARKPGSHHFYGIKNPDLIHKIEYFSPDIIIVYGWKFHSHLSVIKYFKRKAIIYFRGDSHLLDRKFSSRISRYLKYPLLKWIYKDVDCFLSPGHASDKYFKFYGWSNKQILRVVHAVDNARYKSVDKVELQSFISRWKSELSIPSAAPVFMYAGKFEKIKNIELLISAFQKITIQVPNLYLILVGSGEQINQYKQQISTPNIKFIPFFNQSLMPYVYRLAKIFILPSKSETWGLSVNEAMACGLSIIASDNCGCHLDLIQAGSNGYVFKSNDVNDLQSKMLLTLESMSEMADKNPFLIEGYTFEKSVLQLTNHILSN